MLQAIDTVDDMAVRAVMKAFMCFQPPPETTAQLLLREIALDGGRIPSRLLDQPQPMPLRFKYALDGCKCASRHSPPPYMYGVDSPLGNASPAIRTRPTVRPYAQAV